MSPMARAPAVASSPDEGTAVVARGLVVLLAWQTGAAVVVVVIVFVIAIATTVAVTAIVEPRQPKFASS